MSLSDLLYVVIPATNGLANILLKLSVDARLIGKKKSYLLMQLCGYGLFLLVMALAYLFLLQHDASQFVVILSLNYLVTLYASRWIFKDSFSRYDIACDLLIVAGVVIFTLGKH